MTSRIMQLRQQWQAYYWAAEASTNRHRRGTALKTEGREGSERIGNYNRLVVGGSVENPRKSKESSPLPLIVLNCPYCYSSRKFCMVCMQLRRNRLFVACRTKPQSLGSQTYNERNTIVQKHDICRFINISFTHALLYTLLGWSLIIPHPCPECVSPRHPGKRVYLVIY